MSMSNIGQNNGSTSLFWMLDYSHTTLIRAAFDSQSNHLGPGRRKEVWFLVFLQLKENFRIGNFEQEALARDQ